MTEDLGNPRAFRRRGEAFWRRALTAQRHSGLTQLEFCCRNDLSLSTFHRWRQRLDDAAEPEVAETPEFVAVQICSQPAPAESHEGFELQFENGLRLKLPKHVEGRVLAEVLWALEATGVC